jgi:hypothetical protein
LIEKLEYKRREKPFIASIYKPRTKDKTVIKTRQEDLLSFFDELRLE